MSALRGDVRGHPLTWRESHVLQLSATGMSAREVADRLRIAEQTVKSYLAVTYDKLGVHRLIEAMFAMGWVQIKPLDLKARLQTLRAETEEIRQYLDDLERQVDERIAAA